jgi:hypothetical protein
MPGADTEPVAPETPEGLVKAIILLAYLALPSHQRCAARRIEHARRPRFEPVFGQHVFDRPVGAQPGEDRTSAGQANAGDA